MSGPRRKLTRRERDVLVALCAPLADGGAFVEPASTREIADTLGITEAAVKQHLLSLYDKHGITEGDERRRTRLANKAVEAGLVEIARPSGSAPAAQTPLQLARRAASLRNWRRAFELLETVSPEELEGSADDLELLGEAAIWSGHPDESIAARQRAHAMHVKAGNAPRAAVAALLLVINHVMRNQLAQAAGWLEKARRHLGPTPEGLPHGLLLLTEAVFAMYGGQHEVAITTAARALEIADGVNDADLRGLALSVQGYSLSVLGREDEARPKLDEAMASATSGELGPMATGFIYCRTVCASLDTLDHQRALEWTLAIERAGSDPCVAGFPGDCRAHRASIYVLRGDWQAGEREAKTAADEARPVDLRHAGIAQNEIGTVRLRSGDLPNAEAAFLGAHQLGCSPEPGLSLLHLARGDAAGAAALLQAAVDQTPKGTALRGLLLAAMFEVAIAKGDVPAAEATHDELAQIARRHAVPLLRASAAAAGGVLKLAKGDARAACEALREAVSISVGAGAPYETARVRLQLARALTALGDQAAAQLELSAARSVFLGLGAAPALEEADGISTASVSRRR